MQITFETRKRNTGFYVLSMEFEREAPAKDMLVLNSQTLALARRSYFWS